MTSVTVKRGLPVSASAPTTTTTAPTTATTATVRQTEAQRFDAVLDEAEVAHPELKKGSEEYDPATVKAVNYYLAAHEAMGHPGSKALKLALQDVFGAAKAKPEDKPEDKPAGDKTGKS